MKKFKKNLTVLLWAVKLAYRISPQVFVFWLLFSMLLAILPSIVLAMNRHVVAILTAFLDTGQGNFSDVASALVVLGALLILTGLSRRVNGGFLYVTMYDNFYFGMQEYLMDCIQKVDMKTLLDKEFYEDYRYCLYRSGGLTDLMSHGCIAIMKSITAISLILVAVSVSVPIGIIAVGCFGLSVWINFKFSAHLVIDTLQYQALEAESSHYSTEMKKPGVAKEMRVYHNQETMLKKWKNAYEKVLQFDTRYDRNRVTLSLATSSCLYLSTFCMLALSIYQVVDGTCTVDVFLMLYLLGESLSEVNKAFTSSLFEALRGLQALKLQHRFLTRVPMQKERRLDSRAIQETISQQKKNAQIVFEGKNLSFSYDGKTEVLHSLNFRIKKGETIALVGSNGSGKSTLVKLLTDLYQPDRGELLFYGKPYRAYPEGSINHEIGMFFQDFFLFHLSIRENVGFGNLKYLKDDAQIYAALKKGGALSLLEKCKNGLEQILKRDVRKTGMNVSGGEQQKIAVSRTHMSDKDILIFDEPAAALDPIAEMEQFQSIKEKTQGKTSILISHRIGFARMADRIFVLEKGYLAEVGTHEELLQKDGIYADFFRQQAQWYQDEEGGTHGNKN